MPIVWKEEMKVGIVEIDSQHKHFIDLMNEAYQAFNNLAPKEQLEELIDKIIEHKERHFATEEGYFDRYHYEFADEHKEAHRKLSEKVIEFKKRFTTEDNLQIAADLLWFLEDWLVNHLGVYDRKYVSCFREHGLC